MTEGIELRNQEKIRTLEEKETYNYLGILEADTIKQVDMKERAFQENQKTTREKTISKETYQNDKYLRCPPRKILGIILEVDKRRT